MITRDKLVSFLDQYLSISKIQDKSSNGLQVEGSTQITKVALATDAALVTYKRAVEEGCQMLITHHGLIFGGLQYITGRNYQHLKFLIENSLNLYTAHLPLDMHPEVGNNAALARLLPLSKIQPFGDYHGTSIGFSGTINPKTPIKQIEAVFARALDCKPRVLPFGKSIISTVAIVSGGGASLLDEAIHKKIDCLITGEGPHDRFYQAKESNINVIYLGHYKSEIIGVKELGKKITGQFKDLSTIFIDEPTGF